MTTPPQTKIDKAYLTKVQQALQLLLQEVKDQIAGIGVDNGIMIPAVGPSINEYFSPGGTAVKGVTGTYSLPFVPAVDLHDQLGSMGNSVSLELKWLEKTLQDTISGITTTINNFGSAEDINEDAVDQMLKAFQAAVNDLSNPPNNSGSGSGSSGSGSPG